MPKNNEPMSALTHLVGAILSVAALVVLIVFASLNSTAWHIVAFSVFGASLILLYLASTIYHSVHSPRLKGIFRRIDHSMIYVLIAGTYTPVCLIPLRGPWGWSLFGIIWGIAIIGIIIKSFDFPISRWLSTLIYVAMGWVGIIAVVPFVRAVPFQAIFWLLLGGVLYTFGSMFYSLDRRVRRTRWFGMHEVFHVFVLAGSFAHFWLMLRYIVYI